MSEEKTIYFAKYDYRGQGKVFGIKPNDRSRHVYVVGKTGMGKSTMLENMAVQDIRNGNGMAFIDPHGATAETLLSYVPEERIQDVVYFAPFDIDYPISFNMMEDVGYDKRHLVASGLMSAFKKIWKDAWSARMEYILTNTLLALLEYPDSTLIDVNKMLVDKAFRKKVVEYVKDPIVKAFWVEEFAGYTDRYTQEATPAIQNKIGQFVSNPLIRNIIGQKKSSFDFRKVMDEKKILIMNLSKGRMGDVNTQLLGSMLVIKIYLAAMSRADLSPKELQKLPNFYFFVDEFQSFANETFADILSEARKYKLNLTIAHQYIEQMPEEVRDAVFGNVGTMIAFRVGAFDAEVLEKEFAPVFTAEDVVNLGFAQIYLKLMIDGLTSKPFSATTLPPLEHPEKDYKQEVIDYTRAHYAKARGGVEESIREHSASHGESKPTAATEAKPAFVPPKRDFGPLRQGGSEASEVEPAAVLNSGVVKKEAPKNEYNEKTIRPPLAPPPTETKVAPLAQTPSRDNRGARREGRPRDTLPRREFPRRPSEVSHGGERPRVSPPSIPTPPIKREGHPQNEARTPFAQVLRKPESIPKQNERAPNRSEKGEGSGNKASESLSLKFLQSKKDTRSPEHLSELRKALSDALKKEENNADTRIDANDANGKITDESTKVRENNENKIKEETPVVAHTASHVAAPDMYSQKQPPHRPRPQEKRIASRDERHERNQHEIPEDKLRKMLEVKE